MTDVATHEPVTSPGAAGALTLAAAWASAAGSRFSILTGLAMAEARLAALSLALMVFLAMLSAAFVLGAWGLLIAGLLHALIQWHIDLWPALLALGGLHILIAGAAWRGAGRLSKNLEFGNTRKQLVQNWSGDDEMDSAAKES